MEGSPKIQHYLILFIVPITVLLVVLFGRFLPPAIHPAYVIVLAFAILVVFIVRTRLRAQEQAGLKPKKSGFSAKLDLLSQKLRQRAEDLEASERFDREIEFLPAPFTEFVEEIRKTAQQVHQKNVAPQLPSLLDEDSNIVEGLDEEEDDEEEDEEEHATSSSDDRLSKHVAALRQAASEIETYSNEVRSQGGVYKLGGGQLAGCSLMLLGCLGYGSYLVWRFHKSEGWESLAGGGMIVLALLFSYVLYRMQTEPA